MGRWLAAGAWTAVLLAASSDLFSSSHTGGILRSLLGGLLSPEVFEWVHAGLRKLGHLTGYGIASVLYYRAGAGAGTRRAGLLALLLVLVVASVDEVHQSTIPSRTGTPVDVLIDLTGGTIAQLLLRVEWRRRANC
jgi:VanZ family protein